jgi:hypothetical protein
MFCGLVRIFWGDNKSGSGFSIYAELYIIVVFGNGNI